MSPSYRLQKQAGIGLPSALFLIVIMVLIVASINQINELSAEAYGREWLSQRAFYAAESGAQIAATYILNANEAAPACNNSFINNLSLSTPGLSACEIHVACSSVVISSETFLTLTSNGSCGTGPDQASRIIQVRLVDD